MEEGTNKIAISCGDILTLSQQLSDRDVRYARLEMKYDMTQQENEKLKKQLEESETARVAAETENGVLKSEVQRLRSDIDTLKAKFTEIANDAMLSEQEQIERTIALLLENNIILSILKIKEFDVDPGNPSFASVGGFITNKAGDTILIVPEGMGQNVS